MLIEGLMGYGGPCGLGVCWIELELIAACKVWSDAWTGNHGIAMGCEGLFSTATCICGCLGRSESTQKSSCICLVDAHGHVAVRHCVFRDKVAQFLDLSLSHVRPRAGAILDHCWHFVVVSADECC
jgi:hypothetical protein